MKRIVATGIVLLSLCSVAEAHRLFGTVTYYGGNDRLCGRRTASGVAFNCGAMTAAHRTLPFGTVLTVQSGGRSIQVTVTDRGPFTGAFLDLSPAAASALGCRCTHRNVTATVVQMGSVDTVVASRGRQRPVAAAAMLPLFQPRPSHPRWECSDRQWLQPRAITSGTVVAIRTQRGRKRETGPA
jgi:rare lipoprotein A (peptidoglycan hydrolase)